MAFTRVLGPGIHTQANIDSHNINSTGIITAVSFVGDGSGLTGVASTDNIITGTAATFTGGVDINSDIDVDGHTNLDNVSIAGVTTLSGGLTGTTANFSAGLTGTTANFSGNVTVGGVLTYEDVKNVDSVGIITARSGVDVDDFLDVGSNIKLGNAGVITATTFKGDGDFVELDVDGHTNLDNVSVAGITTIGVALQLGDDKQARFGNDNDLTISHSGSNANIENDTGDLIIRTTGASSDDIFIDSHDDINLRVHDTVNAIVATGGGSVDLYYSGSKKFESTNTGAKVTGTLAGASEVGIQSAGTQIGAGITQLNFVGTGNTFAVSGTTVDISIAGGGTGAGGTWSSYTAGIATTKSVGVNTNNLDDNDLVGVGNSFQGLYISNGMIIHDNTLNGNHYIGTTMNGLMAGPVNIEGTLTIDGNYVVV